MAAFDGNKEASIPYDYIYGYLSMIDPPEYPRSLVPNYSVPYGEVFRNYATAILKCTGDLSIIPRSRNELVDMPSWVPDFRFHRSDYKFDSESLPMFRDVRVEDRDDICVVKEVRQGKTVSIYFYGLENVQEAVRTFDTFLDTVSNVRNADKQVILGDCVGYWFDWLPNVETERVLDFYNNAITFVRRRDNPDSQQDVEIKKRFKMQIMENSIFVRAMGFIGRLAQTTVEVKEGDILAMMKGASAPFLLRPTKVEGHNTLVGNCRITTVALSVRRRKLVVRRNSSTQMTSRSFDWFDFTR